MANRSSDCIARAPRQFHETTPEKQDISDIAGAPTWPNLRLVPAEPAALLAGQAAPLDLAAHLRELVSKFDSRGLSAAEFETYSKKWLHDRRYVKGLAEMTLVGYRIVVDRFQWFLTRHKFAECDEDALNAFFAYCREGRDADGGRWGHKCEGKRSKADRVGARTVAVHYNALRAFFNWMVKKGHLARSPFERMDPPKVPKKEPRTYTENEAMQLLQAAATTLQPARDVAILVTIFDCGLRSEEITDLNDEDVDLDNFTIKVWHGKGDKERTVTFGPEAYEILWNYRDSVSPGDGHGRLLKRRPDEPFFLSQRGGRLTTRGISLLHSRLNEKAGIQGVRVSAHTGRNYFATMYLRLGGTLKECQAAMGHTDPRMTLFYARSDVNFRREQHRKCSPISNLLKPTESRRRRRR